MAGVVVGAGRVGSALAERLGVAAHGRGALPSDADFVILAVPERALGDLVRRLPPGVVALHTAGALTDDALRPHRPCGVFHPLMTFPGPPFPSPDLEGVPVRIGGDPEAVALAARLAARCGMTTFQITGDPRLYHAAAVIAGNFATVLLAEAARVLAAAGVPPDQAAATLAPIALASIRNAAVDPRAALTGPAARGDLDTVRAHREALRVADLPDVGNLYDLLSEQASGLAFGRNHRSPDTT